MNTNLYILLKDILLSIISIFRYNIKCTTQKSSFIGNAILYNAIYFIYCNIGKDNALKCLNNNLKHQRTLINTFSQIFMLQRETNLINLITLMEIQIVLYTDYRHNPSSSVAVLWVSINPLVNWPSILPPFMTMLNLKRTYMDHGLWPYQEVTSLCC